MEAAFRLQQQWRQAAKATEQRLQHQAELVGYLHQVLLASPRHLEDRPLLEAARWELDHLRAAQVAQRRVLGFLARFQEYRHHFGLDQS